MPLPVQHIYPFSATRSLRSFSNFHPPFPPKSPSIVRWQSRHSVSQVCYSSVVVRPIFRSLSVIPSTPPLMSKTSGHPLYLWINPESFHRQFRTGNPIFSLQFTQSQLSPPLLLLLRFPTFFFLLRYTSNGFSR